MDHDLIAYLDERFSATSKQISSEITALREETMQRFEQVESAIRQTRVLVEGVRDDMRLVAEGVVGMGERLESFQGNNAKGFDEVQSSVNVYFRDLNHR